MALRQQALGPIANLYPQHVEWRLHTGLMSFSYSSSQARQADRRQGVLVPDPPQSPFFALWLARRLQKGIAWRDGLMRRSGEPFPSGASHSRNLEISPHDDAYSSTARECGREDDV